MSFGLRLAIASAVAVALAVAAVSAVSYVLVADQLRGQVDDTLSSNAEVLSHTPLEVVQNDGELVLRSQRRDLPALDVFVQAVATDGQVAKPAGQVELPVPDRALATARGEHPRFYSDADVGDTHVRMLTVPVGQGFALQLVRPLTDVDNLLGRLRTILIIVSLAGAGVAAGLGALVAKAALKPVRRLTREAEIVAETQDLGHRIAVDGRDELSRLGVSFNTMLAALASSQQAQRQLVADASHELRTPLTSLRTNIEVLVRARELPADRREAMLRDVVVQLEEMTTLVSALVELATDPPPDLETTEIRLDELTEDAVARSQRLAPHVQLVAELSPTTVRGVPGRLERAIVNVLDNAVKWSQPGGTVEVRVAAGAVEVRDHGPGIAEADLPHVFDHFYRAAAARSLPGSGLGLSIVRQVVVQHGGTATVEQPPGGGTLVRLQFVEVPAAPPDVVE